jgi:Chitin synthase
VKSYVPYYEFVDNQVKPGNRGKRDSQLILMRFLNRVHFNLEMSPLELDLYYHLRTRIGVPPNFYEFLFMIDADTEVAPDSASRMIASFMHDTQVIGLCGETGLTNSKQSIITMVPDLFGGADDRYKCTNIGFRIIWQRLLRVCLGV